MSMFKGIAIAAIWISTSVAVVMTQQPLIIIAAVFGTIFVVG